MIPLQKRSTARGGRGSSEHGLPAQLDRQEIDARVEPDHELTALALDRLGDAIGERRNHGRLVFRSHAHAAKATPIVAARIALRSSGTTRSSGAGRLTKSDQEELVRGDRLEIVGRPAVDLARARIDLEVRAASTRHGAARDDAPATKTARTIPGSSAGTTRHARIAAAAEVVDAVDDLLERAIRSRSRAASSKRRSSASRVRRAAAPGARPGVVAVEAVERLCRPPREHRPEIGPCGVGSGPQTQRAPRRRR